MCYSLSHVQPFLPSGTAACQAPLFMGFPSQEYWCGHPFPSLGHLSDARITPRSPVLQAVFTIWATSEAWCSLPSIVCLTLVTPVSNHILLFLCWHLCWRCQTSPGSSWTTKPVSRTAQSMCLFFYFFDRSDLSLFWVFIFYRNIVDLQCFF